MTTRACGEADAAEDQKLPVRSKFTLELGAGTAGLSAALRREGAETIAIDHRHNRHKMQVPGLVLDLATDAGWTLVWRMLSEDRVVYVHGAPPCGTATRAREKPLPLRLRKRGVPSPQQLRSETFPEGLPDLKGIAKQKVDKANLIYKKMTDYLDAC